MFALAIVGTVIVLMMSTLTGGLQALQKGTGYNQATIIAQRTIEECKSLGYTELCKHIYGLSSPDITSQDGFVVKLYIEKSPSFVKVTTNVSRAADGEKTKSINVNMEAFFVED